MWAVAPRLATKAHAPCTGALQFLRVAAICGPMSPACASAPPARRLHRHRAMWDFWPKAASSTWTAWLVARNIGTSSSPHTTCTLPDHTSLNPSFHREGAPIFSMPTARPSSTGTQQKPRAPARFQPTASACASVLRIHRLPRLRCRHCHRHLPHHRPPRHRPPRHRVRRP